MSRNLFEDVDYSGLPEHMRQGARDYIELGAKPGDFLIAVLSNDLVDAFDRADSTNIERMRDIVVWLYNEVPSTAWGSRERVKAWIEKERP
jgi:hypothetical protein